MRCLLIGNFGVGNLGDEALKEYFLSEFTGIDWTVLSAHPSKTNETPRLPAGIRSFFRFGWIKTLDVYRNTDAVVFGGGSLFTDAESPYACFLWWIHAFVAKVYHKPIHFAFQGVGPFETRVGEWFARSGFTMATSISVRDSLSKIRCEHWGLNTKVIQSFDPVFHLIKNKKVDLSTKNVLILLPRKNSYEKFMMAAQKYVESMQWEEVRVLSMQPDNKSEIECCQFLVNTYDAITVPVHTLDELLHAMCDAKQVVTERYHGALAAIALGKSVEIISQKDGDKLDVIKKNIPDATLIQAGARHLRELL